MATEVQKVMQDRRAALAERLRTESVDLAIIGPGANFSYFTGRRPISTERLLALLVTANGSCQLIAPELQAPLYNDIAGVQLATWRDGEQPADLLLEQITACKAQRIAVNDEFYSGFLLALQAGEDRQFVSGERTIDAARAVKQDHEISALARAAEAIDETWQQFCASCGPLAGQSEFALRTRLQQLMQRVGFSEISWIDVGAGANGASPLHHGSDYVIGADEPVVFDFAGCFDGYYGDICRVALTGTPPDEYQALYDLVLSAQQTACRAVRPGVSAQQIDAVARQQIADGGFGDYFTHRIGHGIGLAAHESPWIVAGNPQPLAAGMAFSLEPGVYIPGRWGVRIEDILVVTAQASR
ncbi:hypothetical protein BTJ39_02450 [Izhakiella australiensis]|uniref:Peptidase M24 n=1 Tax=Izhakiella australiensis TaxID=1926881 RepID=A0A1S8YT38_9GAMM|nr:Xaa-Pro peptidase family protein [Izhakiella australiensis]OON42035.1 hypothetical protein BTJ39_02450 [Izhakiella australiensis]